MALTLPRWIAFAVAACALAWFGLVFRAPVADRPDARAENSLGGWDGDPGTLRMVTGRLAQANDRLRLLELRDSIARLGTAHGGDASLDVFLDELLPSDVRRTLESAIAARWTGLGISSPHHAVAIAVVIDTSTAPHGLPRTVRFAVGFPIDAFLPSAATNGRCVSVARLSVAPRKLDAQLRGILGRNLTSDETVGALLNPCALFAAFGEPGPRIEEWLRDGRWVTARFANWNAAPTPWRVVTRPRRDYYVGNDAGWIAALSDPSWEIRRYVAPLGIACIAGESGTCARMALDVYPTAFDTAWRSTVVAGSGTSASSFFFPSRVSSTGPAEGWFVSEMVRTLGAERFGRFWRSPLPVESAFKEAAGEDLDRWARDWGQRMYGPAIVGPHLSAPGLAIGLAILVIALVVSISIERRRRVA